MSRLLLADNEDGGHDLSDTQLNIIRYISYIANSLSLFGSIFIIANYSIIPSLRNQFSYKLILWIAISDAVFSIALLLGSPEANTPLCYIQAIMIQISISSTLWVVAISWTINHLLHSSKLPTNGELKRILRNMHIIIWSITGITVIIPLITESYGIAGGWCWIKGDEDHTIGLILRYIVWYGPIWMSVVYMIIVYIRAWIKFRMERKEMMMNSMNSKPEMNVNMDSMEIQTILEKQKKRRKVLKRMIFYPLILIICYTFASIRRIIESVGGNEPFWITAAQLATGSSVGFFDAIIYGLTKDVREMDKQYIKNKCTCFYHTDDDDQCK